MGSHGRRIYSFGAQGEAPQLIGQIPENPHAVAPARRNGEAFGLRAEIDTQPAAGGTRVVVHSLAATRANITIEADVLRRFVAELPGQIQGSIETGVANLWASGEFDPGGSGEWQAIVRQNRFRRLASTYAGKFKNDGWSR
jgi:hypothetical protein